MPDDPRRLYWDTNVFLVLLSATSDPVDQDHCRQLLQQAASGEVLLFTSTLTPAELLKPREAEYPLNSEQRTRIRELFQRPYVRFVLLDPAIAFRAQDLSWDYPIHAKDNVHVASALRAEVDIMQTYDGAGRRRGLLDLDGQIGEPPLRIEKPVYEGQQELPGLSEE